MAITKQYKVIEEVEIDFIYKNPSPIIMCPQFENGERAIKVKLKNGGEDFTVPSGYTPHVFMLKFDKKVVDNICEYDGNVVMVKITKQMSFVEGRNLMRIALVSDTTGEYAQTCEIYLRVTEGADVAGAEHSTDEFEALVQYANQAKDSADKAAQSEANAKASETAAIAARKGAEDAESRVNAIVAGNEAYTKQQSHDLFAAALVTKTGPAASLEVYPDKLSNLKVYANGFTTQAGSGDPSPSNVRQLTNGGLKLVELALNGTEGWEYRSNLGFFVSAANKAQGKATNGSVYCSWFQGVNAAQPSNDNSIAINAYGQLVLKASGYNGNVTALTTDLSSKNATGDPVIVWYQPADESQATGLYAPIILQGGEYRATCLPLTAPLCEGDSVVSWVKSGCDKTLVLDGTQSLTWNSSSESPYGGWFSVSASDVPAPVSGIVPQILSDQLFAVRSVASLFVSGIVSNASGSKIVFTLFGQKSVEDANAYLAQNPITIWYRSTNYTESADIPVSLETHQQAVLVLDGTENFQLLYGDNTFVWEANKAAKGDQTILCDHYKGVNTGWASLQNNQIQMVTNGRYIGAKDTRFSTAAEFKAYLAAQYAAGTPVTIVYQLATPITYAHPPAVMPALPDNTGKVTITGQSGGTVTVVFNKSIIKEIAEIKAAMLAMGANLSM